MSNSSLHKPHYRNLIMNHHLRVIFAPLVWVYVDFVNVVRCLHKSALFSNEDCLHYTTSRLCVRRRFIFIRGFFLSRLYPGGMAEIRLSFLDTKCFRYECHHRPICNGLLVWWKNSVYLHSSTYYAPWNKSFIIIDSIPVYEVIRSVHESIISTLIL